MSSHSNYLDGNAAAGELSNIFKIDVTSAEAHCANCGTTKRLAEAHVYIQGPGVVARCAACEHVLLRLVNIKQRVLLDVRGLMYLSIDTSTASEQ
jgi:recombinational DNA repair protein (RecF pathway)